jgi:hypothetical protein
MTSYDFEAKATYRARLWGSVDAFSKKHRSLRTVIYLDTKEALASQHLLSMGYSPANLHAVNRNPAEMAHLSMTLDRLGLPRVQTYGLDFKDAIRRGGGRFDVVDFDGTSQLHDALIETVHAATIAAIGGVLSVTVLGGRETTWTDRIDMLKRVSEKTGRHFETRAKTSWNEMVSRRHAERLRLLLMCACVSDTCAAHVVAAKWSVYVSTSKQPMAWVVAKVAPHTMEALGRRGTLAGDRVASLAYYPPCYVSKAIRNSLSVVSG